MKFFIASALLAVGYTASRLARSQQVSYDAREAIVAIPEAASGVAALRIKPYEPDIDASRSDITTPGELNFDIGILSRKNQEEWDTSFVNSRRLQASSCTSGSVVCDNGFDAANLGEKCADACLPDKCCVGTSACDNFNGEVCMDGESCMGDQACFNATITSVVKGCNGTSACFRAGYNGTIGLVDNSCQGNSACAEAAASGYYIDENGDDFYYYGGTINDITDSCIGDKSCYATARFQGYVGSILNSCHGTSGSCYSAGGFGGSIDSIVGSCNGTSACMYTAETYGKIETISESCVGEEACKYAAYYGDILGFRLSCNAPEACYGMNKGIHEDSYYDPIESVLDNCCNADSACANQDTFPGECVPSTSPSTSPSTLPSESPSKSPSTSPSDSPSASPTESAAPSVMPSTSEPTAAPTKSPTGRPTTAKPTVMATSAKPTTSAPTGPEKNESNAKAAKNGKGDKAGKEAKEGKEGKKGKKDPATDVATLVEEGEGGDENSSKFGFAVERKRVHASGGGENNPGLRSASDKNRV